MKNIKTIRILGIRGIPAAHGGFETFAEKLSSYLVHGGWRVIVYCQVDENEDFHLDTWQGIERVNIPISIKGALGTIFFDLFSILHACKSRDLCLVLGYNTAIFALLLRLRGIRVLMNMDGIEWKRAKWGLIPKSWFWLNEKIGSLLSNHLIADHPEIKNHLASSHLNRNIRVISYGGDEVLSANLSDVLAFGLEPYKFFTVIARPEPENSILEIVRGYAMRQRDIKLVILGEYSSDNEYHNLIMSYAGKDIIFLGAIYNKEILNSLRYFSYAYIHGHQVGGTNPSLVEAMAAGNAVIAHDNKFNNWVTNSEALYFKDEFTLDECITKLDLEPLFITELRNRSKFAFASKFTWTQILKDYEDLFLQYL